MRTLCTAALLSILISCSSVSSDGASLEGTFWRLVAIQSMDDSQYRPQDGALYTIEFHPDRRLFVQADCNHGQGTWMQGGSELKLGRIGMTKMMCGPNSLEVRFLRDLDYVRSFVMRRNKLFVATLADGAVLEFEASAPSLTPSTTVHYRCEQNGFVRAHFNNDSDFNTVVLTIDQRQYLLSQEVSASGARYRNAEIEFWEKGGTAQLTGATGDDNCLLY